MFATISQGHADAADVLFLIAAIIFGLAAIWPHVNRADGTAVNLSVSLVPLGLCLLAVAWFVL